MKFLKYNSENYEGDERPFLNKDVDNVVSSYRIFILVSNSSGFDSWGIFDFIG